MCELNAEAPVSRLSHSGAYDGSESSQATASAQQYNPKSDGRQASRSTVIDLLELARREEAIHQRLLDSHTASLVCSHSAKEKACHARAAQWNRERLDGVRARRQRLEQMQCQEVQDE
jgi:hypothetical protein